VALERAKKLLLKAIAAIEKRKDKLSPGCYDALIARTGDIRNQMAAQGSWFVVTSGP
jgi:hypothetical protein